MQNSQTNSNGYGFSRNGIHNLSQINCNYSGVKYRNISKINLNQPMDFKWSLHIYIICNPNNPGMGHAGWCLLQHVTLFSSCWSQAKKILYSTIYIIINVSLLKSRKAPVVKFCVSSATYIPTGIHCEVRLTVSNSIMTCRSLCAS